MKMVQAADTAVSIWITREEVPTGKALLTLIRQALAERGLTPWPSAEIECFAAGEDTLVIARPAHARRPAFYFPELETLLSGALCVAEEEGTLYGAGEGYLLALRPEAVVPALYEYGAASSVTAGWEVHAREQGRCLIEQHAAGVLRRHFSR